jgi:hypothetical protein
VAYKAAKAYKASLVYKDHQVLVVRVSKVPAGLLDYRDNKAHRAYPVQLAYRDSRAYRDNKDHRVFQVHRAQLAPQVPQVVMPQH